jgi:hypothetical protein
MANVRHRKLESFVFHKHEEESISYQIFAKRAELAALENQKDHHRSEQERLLGELRSEFGPRYCMLQYDDDDESMPTAIPPQDLSLVPLAAIRQKYASLDQVEGLILHTLKSLGRYLIDNKLLENEYHQLPCPHYESWGNLIASVPSSLRSGASEEHWVQWWVALMFHIKWPRHNVYTAEAIEIQNQDIPRWDRETLTDPCFGLKDEYIRAKGIDVAALRRENDALRQRQGQNGNAVNIQQGNAIGQNVNNFSGHNTQGVSILHGNGQDVHIQQGNAFAQSSFGHNNHGVNITQGNGPNCTNQHGNAYAQINVGHNQNGNLGHRFSTAADNQNANYSLNVNNQHGNAFAQNIHNQNASNGHNFNIAAGNNQNANLGHNFTANASGNNGQNVNATVANANNQNANNGLNVSNQRGNASAQINLVAAASAASSNQHVNGQQGQNQVFFDFSHIQ